MANTVIGLFDNPTDANLAVQELMSYGFRDEDIDISLSEDPAEREKYRSSIDDFFNSLFGNTDEARTYSDMAQEGSTVITVHASGKKDAEKASMILDDNGALDINNRMGTEYRSHDEGYSETSRLDMDRDLDKDIPVIEEEMEVGKRSSERGNIRIRSRIVEKPVEEHLRLRSEYVDIERNPVNRPATDEELRNFKDQTFEISEKEEVPVVNKEARVVEEINVKKKVEERDEKIRGSVKRQDVEIDKKREKDKSPDRYDADGY